MDGRTRWMAGQDGWVDKMDGRMRWMERQDGQLHGEIQGRRPDLVSSSCWSTDPVNTL